MHTSVELSIIILNYRSEKLCQQCLEALAKFPPSCRYEVILVDNYSRDEGVKNFRSKWIEKLPMRFVELEKNLGYGQGNAAGIKTAMGEFFAIINPDIEVREKTLDGLLEYLRKHADVGLIAPKLILPNDQIQDSFRRFPVLTDLIIKRLPWLRKIFKHRMERFLMWNIDLTVPSTVDWVVGACFVIRKTAWEKSGGFDPRYFLFLEDTDLCRTLWEKNWRVVFHPEYSVRHHHHRLSETHGFLDMLTNRMIRIHIRSAMKYFWKWRGEKNPRQ